MKKSTLLMVLSLVLALTIGLGTTLAYLTDTDSDVNVMTLGNVDILQNEQERDSEGNLQPFTPNKPAYPAVGPIEWADETITFGDSEFKVFDDDLKNVVDKFVTVTNTGKSDAYVRTIIALEAPDYDAKNLIHVNVNNTSGVSATDWAPLEIDGVEYVYSVFTYEKPLAAGETSLPSLMQVFLDSKTTNEDVAAYGDTWEILVLSQAVQTAGFADAKTALNEAFPMGEANANVPGWFTGWTEDDIGSPGDEWISNNPPSFVPEGAETVASVEELDELFANGGEAYLTENLTLSDDPIVVPNGNDVTLHMNGKTISATSTSDKTSYGIEVKNGATLKLKGEGLITFYASQPDTEWGGEGQPPFPGYANNTIKNNGTLIIDGPTVENKTAAGGASYAIDCYQGSDLTINSGEIKGYDKVAIRMFANSATQNTGVTINGGEISGSRAIWLQLPSSDFSKAMMATLEINGGTLTAINPDAQPVIYSYSYGNSFANTYVTITGGTFNGDVQFSGGANKKDQEKVSVTGGTFNGALGHWLANDGWQDITKP